jgi:alpha-L-rhamnosidase
VEVPLRGTTFSGSTAAGLGPGAGGPPSPPFEFDKVSLVGPIGDNAAVFKTLKAKSVREVCPGVFVYDIGQNIVGVPRITIPNGQAGKVITLRYSEILYPNLPESGNNVGMPMTENYRAAMSQDLYTMKAGPQTLQPSSPSAASNILRSPASTMRYQSSQCRALRSVRYMK